MVDTETFRYETDGWHSLLNGRILTPGPPDPPPPVASKFIGYYTAGNNISSSAANRNDPRYPNTTIYNTPVDTLTAGWPTPQNLHSYYINWGAALPAHLLSHGGPGNMIQLELMSKRSNGTFITYNDVTAGLYDAQWISYIQQLDGLGCRVLLAFENEVDLKINDSTKVAAGQTFAQYRAALNHVYDLIHTHSTNVESLLWLAGGSTANCVACLPDKTKLDNVGWDPYKRGDNTALDTTGIFQSFIDRVLVPNGYDDTTQIKRHISETGIKTDPFSNNGFYTEADQIAFYQGIPAAMDALDIESVIWFRDNAGSHNYIPVPPMVGTTVDDAFRDMIDATIGGSTGGAAATPVTALSATLTNIGDPDVASGNPVNEASGLIVSRKNKASGRVFWTHNDSGGTPTIYAYDDSSSGLILAQYDLTGASNHDWEDITQGPGPTAGVKYLYIGDIGSSNTGDREIYRVVEPTVAPGQAHASGSIACEVFTFTPPAAMVNCESLMCDPVTGDLFMVEKSGGTTRPRNDIVWHCPASQLVAGGGTITWTNITTVRSITSASTNDSSITGGDISADGSYIAICNYQEVWLWNRDPATQTVADVLIANPVGPIYRAYGSGWGAESLAFDADIQPARMWTITEGPNAGLKYAGITY